MSLTTSEMTPADIAAVTNNNGGGWGDNGLWWLAILFLFGRGGLGGYGGYGGEGGGGYATQADVQRAVDQQTLISKLDGQTYGLADATFALNNTIVNGFSSAELSRCQQQAALMAQLNSMAADSAKCCCETQRLLERGFAETNYNLAMQFCETRHQAEKNTREIVDNANGNTRAILDFLVQEKLASKDARIAALEGQVGRSEQNAFFRAAIDASAAEIIRRTGHECPTPAYWVSPPTPVQVPNQGCGWSSAA